MTSRPLSRQQFLNRLLAIMDVKHHWAWPHFAGAEATKAQLKIHFQQEYAVYVRDFPTLLARIHGQNPPFPARRTLAENIYEEDTGGLSLGVAHPQLFLKMMRGLGFQERIFEKIALLPASRRYRQWLDQVSTQPPWVVGMAVLTIFVEGSVNDRQALRPTGKAHTSTTSIEAHIAHHPLVKYQGVAPAFMDLIRAHQMVEGGHRRDAYDMTLQFAETRRVQLAVLRAIQETLQRWLHYRDGVAKACSLRPPQSRSRQPRGKSRARL